MSAAFFQITDIEQGADWALLLNLQNSDGSATNLTGCTLKMQIRTAPLDANGTVLANLTSSNGGITIVSAIAGQTKIALTANQTANIPATNNFFDVFLTDATGRTTRPVEGGAAIQPRITS